MEQPGRHEPSLRWIERDRTSDRFHLFARRMVSSANAMVSVSAFSIVLFEDIKRRCTCVARPRRAAEDGSVADEQWIVCVVLAMLCGGERRRDGHRCHRVLSTPDCGMDPSLLPSLSQISLKILMSRQSNKARQRVRDDAETMTARISATAHPFLTETDSEENKREANYDGSRASLFLFVIPSASPLPVPQWVSTRSLLVCLLAGCSSNWSIALHPDCRLALSMFPTLTR
ncbi:hypothetical protein BLNAU_21757 [Blattamonas nauphoetae]|uniref:Uncharacterized protein n=1 Tax=Blattamonas nauphoetae TaxID=2049346 RepID=A0ABQ9WXA9_9EUKA|nr:hypothetical protein BLNAU_21757 [Blattamonas nauphoetae]